MAFEDECAAYAAYKALDRLPTNAPAFDFLENGYPIVNYGEKMCRAPTGEGGLCGKILVRYENLLLHLEAVHEMPKRDRPRPRKQGALQEPERSKAARFYEELMKDETYDKEKKKVKMSDTTSSRMDDAPQRITHDRSTTAPSNSVDTHAEIEIPVKEEEEEASLTAASDDVITMVCYRPINRELEEELPRAETMEVGGEDEDEELELELQEAEEQVRLEQAQLRSIQLKRKLAERKKKRAA